MLGSLGLGEILTVVAIGAVFFLGPAIVRGAGTKLGENIREGRKAMKGIFQAIKEDPKTDDPPKA